MSKSQKEITKIPLFIYQIYKTTDRRSNTLDFTININEINSLS